MQDPLSGLNSKIRLERVCVYFDLFINPKARKYVLRVEIRKMVDVQEKKTLQRFCERKSRGN